VQMAVPQRPIDSAGGFDYTFDPPVNIGKELRRDRCGNDGQHKRVSAEGHTPARIRRGALSLPGPLKRFRTSRDQRDHSRPWSRTSRTNLRPKKYQASRYRPVLYKAGSPLCLDHHPLSGNGWFHGPQKVDHSPRLDYRTGRAGLASSSLDRSVRVATAIALTPVRWC
jgi:hypothetical protein